MIKQLGIIAMALLIFGCSQDESGHANKEIIAGDDIIGLASPVKLNYDTSTVYLLDYFEDASKIDIKTFMERRTVNEVKQWKTEHLKTNPMSKRRNLLVE